VGFFANGSATPITGCGTQALTHVSGSTYRATCSTSTLPVGPHSITATYSGDPSYTTSSGTLAGGQVVNQPPSMPVVASPQFGIPNQTDAFGVAPDGTLQVRWVQGNGAWHGPLAISAPGFAPAGSHLAVSQQFGIPNQTDVFVVGANGAIDVFWVEGAGTWHGPRPITGTGTSTPGAGLAASNQIGIPNQTDVWVVDNNKAINVSWVQGAGTWQGPLRITQPDFAPAGAPLATSPQFGAPNQTDVFVLANNGAIWVSWVQGRGSWQGPLAISPGNSTPGAGLTASAQFGVPNQTDVFVVENDDAIHVSWVQGGGSWQGPLRITPTGVAQPSAELASSQQFGISNQTDVFTVEKDGTIDVSWVRGGGTWQGPLAITRTGFAAPGAPLVASNQFGISSQTDVYVVGSDASTHVSWVEGGGTWMGPLQI
jgi:hypothetical protein